MKTFEEYLFEDKVSGGLADNMNEGLIKVGNDFEIPEEDLIPIGLDLYYYKVKAGRGKLPEMVFLNKYKKPIAVRSGGKVSITQRSYNNKAIRDEIESHTGMNYYKFVSEITL